jgi:transposase-like protein
LEIYKKEKHKKSKDKKLIVFVSDGFENYKNAFNKLFCYVAKLVFGIPIKLKKHGVKHNNNAIERYNSDIDDRTKTMRHFGSFERAGYFLNLRHLIHNFVNPHMQLNGRTPAEEAGIDLELRRNKLLNLIKIVARNYTPKR